MVHHPAIVMSLLCVLAVTGSAQARRPTRTGPPTLSTTTPTPAPAPALTLLTLSHDSISGGPGYWPNGKVTLSAAAPASGIVVTLTSDNSAASVPTTVMVPAGATEATFPVTTTTVAVPTLVGITARAGNVSVTDSLRVLLTVVSVVNEGWVPGSTTYAWRVTLSGPAPPAGLTVHATYTAPGAPPQGVPPACLPLPAFTSAVVPAGATSGVMTATIDGSLTRPVTWYVAYGGRYQAQQLWVLAASIAGVDVPTTLAGGTTAYATVRLTGKTPNARCASSPQFTARYNNLFTVFISSSNPSVIQVQPSARVDPSQTERAFPITASAVQSAQTVTITVSRPAAAADGLAAFTKQVSVSVTP